MLHGYYPHDVMNEEPSHIEYEAGDDGYWRIDRPDRLEEDFGVTAGHVQDWHLFLSGQGRAWEICRRLYQAGSLLDPPPEIIRTWSREEVAKEFGIPKAEVDHEINHAAEEWRLRKARADVTRASKVEGEDEIAKLTSFSNSSGLEPDQVSMLLNAYGFGDVRDEMLRAQVANRIISLKDYLISQHSRTKARQLIRMEMSLHAKEKMLLIYTNKIEHIVRTDPNLNTHSTDLENYRVKAAELDKEIRQITKDHTTLQDEIGANDIDMTTRKRIFVETVAYIQLKCQEYESDPESVLLDGVFRADEIDWLLESLGDRRPQYRPDITVRLHDALLPRNLWDPEYKPPKLTLRVCQELRRMADCMRAVPEDAAPLPDMEAEDDGLPTGDGLMPPMEPIPADAISPSLLPAGMAAHATTRGSSIGVY
jgi:hypothetical protein